MGARTRFFVGLAALVIGLSACKKSVPTLAPTPAPPATAVPPTPVIPLTNTPIYSPTISPTPTPVYTTTITATASPTYTRTNTFTATPTATPTSTQTATPTHTPTHTNTITLTYTMTPTPCSGFPIPPTSFVLEELSNDPVDDNQRIALFDPRPDASFRLYQDGVLVGISPGTANTFTFTSLTNGQPYEFYATVLDGCGVESGASAKRTDTP